MLSDYTAHAKVILIGEHAVVYGADALCIPMLNLTLHAHVAYDEQGPTLETEGYCGPFEQAPEIYNGIMYLFQELVVKRQQDTHCRLTLDSRIPMARGLGSSAASALATIKAFDQYFQLGISEADVTVLGNHAEDIVHGKASGLDFATVRSEKLVSFNRATGFNHIDGKLGAYLVIADTGAEGSTKEAVAMVRQQREASERNRERLDYLGVLSDRAARAWVQQDVLKLGDICNQAQEILASFGVSTPMIDTLVDTAREAGALGAKLSGSGLGGVVIALTQTREQAQQVAQALSSKASGVWVEEL